MAYDLSERLVIGVASSALFDLAESDRVFRDQGEASYRIYQHITRTFHSVPALPSPSSSVCCHCGGAGADALSGSATGVGWKAVTECNKGCP
ncbi:5'-nucleotidase [Billgrantia diversa]|uniref:5'-nucleotidase n=1 Tax=Halomonas sp. MCCC 1A13316 TaxID=2733487 RepID=UPI0018D3BFB9|nr:5'-nucleotidase [Halomonas sp. MCCC 1A13316]